MTFLDRLAKIGAKELARSYRACLKVFYAAAGAGLITTATVFFKLLILHAPFGQHAPFGACLVGFLGGTNFAASFLFMQAFGLRLMTKQAPFLGVALGKRWREMKTEDYFWTFKTLIASAAGNLFLVIASSFIMEQVYKLCTGSSLLDFDSAVSAVRNYLPCNFSNTFYAVLTGVLLWCCTVLSGRIATRLAPLSKNLVVGLFNILFGFMLAFTPILGKVLALPLDVRHFTIAGGILAVAYGTLGTQSAMNAGLVSATLGVLWIGVLNSCVSFGLSFASTRYRVNSSLNR